MEDDTEKRNYILVCEQLSWINTANGQKITSMQLAKLSSSALIGIWITMSIVYDLIIIDFVENCV